MADDELKRLLEELFSDIPTEIAPKEAPPEGVVERRDADLLEKLAARFQTAARLSHAASSILNLDELLPQVVNLIRDEFDFYFVGIFLVDERQEWAILQAGTGTAGRQMIEQGHRLQVGGDSMIGWCTANQQARIALDVGEEAVRFANPLLPITRSEMALPLLSRGRVIGAMTIQSAAPAAFSEEDITILQTMADQLANAIENARLFQERERRITESAIVNEIGQALATVLELDQLLQTVHEQVSRLFDATNFYIVTYEQGSDEWLTQFHLENGQRQPFDRHSIHSGLTGYIIRNRQPLLFRSMEENIAFSEAKDVPVIGEMARSWLGVPLITAEKLVGVMAIQNYEYENLYDEQDLTLFSTVAAQVANALDNQRLLAETRRRARELEAINEVGWAITSVLDLDAVLRQIVDITRARFGHYYVSIMLLEGDRLFFQEGSTVGDSDIRVEPGQVTIDLLQSQSLNAEAARTGQPVLVNDVLSDPRYLPLAELPATRSELDVPIEVKGRVIGVLGVQSDQPFAYDQTDVALLQSLASQAGVAIENARLFEETRRRVVQTQLFLGVSEATASTLESMEVMRRTARAVAGALRADTAAAYVFDSTGTKLEPVAGYHVPHEQLEMYQQSHLPVEGHAFIEEALRNQQTVFTSDAANDPRYDEALAQLIPARSVLLTPMIVKGEVIGALWAVWWEEAHHLTDEEQRLAEGMVRQAAVAIDSARLFEEQRRRADELSALHEVSLELAQEQRDLDSLLETITRRTMALLASDGAGIWLWREDDQELELVITHQVGNIDFTGRRLKPGEGLTGRAFAERKIQVIDDYRTWPGKSPVFHDTPSISSLAIPMLWQAQVVGALVVTRSESGHPYSADEQDLADLLAAQAAAVIQNARLLEEARQRVQELAILSDTSQALAAAPLQAQEIADTVVRRLVKAMDISEVAICLLDQQQDKMHVLADLGIVDGELRPVETPEVFRLADYPATVRTIETRQPVVVQASDPGADAAELAWMLAEGVKSLLMVPMVVRDNVVGSLELIEHKKEREFTATEIRLCQTLANQAAVILENARLFEETQSRARRERILREITSRVRRGTDRDAIMRIALQELGQILGASKSVVRLGTQEQLLSEQSRSTRET